MVILVTHTVKAHPHVKRLWHWHLRRQKRPARDRVIDMSEVITELQPSTNTFTDMMNEYVLLKSARYEWGASTFCRDWSWPKSPEVSR